MKKIDKIGRSKFCTPFQNGKCHSPKLTEYPPDLREDNVIYQQSEQALVMFEF